MTMKRREFLRSTLAGAGALAFAPTVFASTGPDTGPYRTVTLGKTGLKTSLIGFGTGMRGSKRQSDHTRLGQERFEALLKAAHQRGIRFFDMADLYGTHAYVGRAMAGVPRDRLILSSKIWVRKGGIPEAERPDAHVVVERFRKEVNTDYLDIVQIHCMTDAKWTDQQKRQMDILENLKAKGLIRAHGVSCHSTDALEAAAECPWVDVIHARTNAFGVKMDGPAEKVAPILKKAAAAGKGIIGMKLIGEGTFRDDDAKKDASIQWALGPGCCHMMIVGFLSETEIDDFERRVARVGG